MRAWRSRGRVARGCMGCCRQCWSRARHPPRPRSAVGRGLSLTLAPSLTPTLTLGLCGGWSRAVLIGPTLTLTPTPSLTPTLTLGLGSVRSWAVLSGCARPRVRRDATARVGGIHIDSKYSLSEYSLSEYSAMLQLEWEVCLDYLLTMPILTMATLTMPTLSMATITMATLRLHVLLLLNRCASTASPSPAPTARRTASPERCTEASSAWARWAPTYTLLTYLLELTRTYTNLVFSLTFPVVLYLGKVASLVGKKLGEGVVRC